MWFHDWSIETCAISLFEDCKRLQRCAKLYWSCIESKSLGRLTIFPHFVGFLLLLWESSSISWKCFKILIIDRQLAKRLKTGLWSWRWEKRFLYGAGTGVWRWCHKQNCFFFERQRQSLVRKLTNLKFYWIFHKKLFLTKNPTFMTSDNGQPSCRLKQSTKSTMLDLRSMPKPILLQEKLLRSSVNSFYSQNVHNMIKTN